MQGVGKIYELSCTREEKGWYHACIATYSKYWKEIEEKWPHLRNLPRNARISLAMDGVNPFRDLRTTYLVWIVLITNNNLTPSMVLMGENVPHNKEGHYPFQNSQLNSQMFGVLGSKVLWTHYYSNIFELF